MARTIMILLIFSCLHITAASQETGRFAISADLAEAVRGTASLCVSCGFADRWSADAGASLDLTRLKSSVSDEENRHAAAFATGPEVPPSPKDFHILSMSVKYWPSGRFREWFISAGLENGDLTGPDITAGAGYAIHIGKGVGIIISYGIGIRKCVRKDIDAASGISISISYNFRK